MGKINKTKQILMSAENETNKVEDKQFSKMPLEE